MTIKELVFVDNLHGIWFADAGCFGRYYISEFRRINGECVDYHCSFVDHSTNGSQSIPSKFRLVQWERALRECQAHYENLESNILMYRLTLVGIVQRAMLPQFVRSIIVAIVTVSVKLNKVTL